MKARALSTSVGLLTAFSVCLFAGTARNAHAAPPTTHADDLENPKLTGLMSRLIVVEAQISAINRQLGLVGYHVAQQVDEKESHEKGNELMDRRGGGPIGWKDFYGRTAKDYGNNDWGDRRPLQFERIYKANNDQIRKAEREVEALSAKRDTLLAKRAQYEAEQVSIWALVAWGTVANHELYASPIYRFRFKQPTSTTAASKAKFAALAAAVDLVRALDAALRDGLETVEGNPAGTLDDVASRAKNAYSTFRLTLADNEDADGLSDEERKSLADIRKSGKNLSDLAEAAAQAYRMLVKDDAEQSKLSARGVLQYALLDVATGTLKMDDLLGHLAKTWRAEIDKANALPTPVSLSRGTTNAGAVTGQTLSDLLPSTASLQGEYVGITQTNRAGTFTIEIKERDGENFKGRYFPDDGVGLNVEVAGSISGDHIKMSSINSPRQIEISGDRKGGSLNLEFVNERGDRYSMVAKLINILPEGSSWTGRMKMYMAGKYRDSSELKASVTKRDRDKIEIVWETKEWGGKVKIDGSLSQMTLSGIYSESIAGDWPRDVIGNAKIEGVIQPDGKTITSGTYEVPGSNPKRTGTWELKLDSK